jgi:hypothetical protein
MCSICNRNHENENPYLVIAGENRDVFLDCRRNNDNKKLLVGSLGAHPKCITSSEKELSKPDSPKKSLGLEGIVIQKPERKKESDFDVKKFIHGSVSSKRLNFSLRD